MKVAIYSRKSKYTGKGDSIGNQIQMCKDYITSIYPNEKISFTEYEDEGYTGAITDRPQFKKLMNDITKKNYDALICYRLDRISRNVADFSSTLSFLQNYNTNFISIKEQFDTSTPMGRAMIYIASVFAQLERETIAERVRDNMMELAKSGKWSGGRLPLGYDSETFSYTDENGKERKSVKLVPNEKELELVKLIYDTYLKEGSLHKTEVYFSINNIKSNKGILLEKTSLKVILQNPIYVKSTQRIMDYLENNSWNVYGNPDGVSGLLSYNKTSSIIKDGKYVKIPKHKEDWIAAVSNIPGIIDDDQWIKVQEQFKANKNTFPRLGKTNNALLTGKLKCGLCKSNMRVVHGRVSKVTGEKFFYYSCSLKTKSRSTLCSSKNVKADRIEESILTSLEKLGNDKTKFYNNLKKSLNTSTRNKNLKLEIEKLKSQIDDKQKLLNGLLDKLALAPDIEEIFLKRIKDIKSEINVLEKQIDELKDTISKNESVEFTLDLTKTLLDKCTNIRNLPFEVQKQVINGLIESIDYNSETDEVTVNFYNSEGSKKKLLL